MMIRPATLDDAQNLLAIYAQYIETPITFEFELPSLREFTDRIAKTTKNYPYLVAEENERLCGYAYAGQVFSRAAYQWGAELSIYLDRGCIGRGLGTELYLRLIEILQNRGVRTVYGCVTTPNPASERLHETTGFRKIGIFRNAGFKNGSWHDVAWFEKQIGTYSVPNPLIPFEK